MTNMQRGILLLLAFSLLVNGIQCGKAKRHILSGITGKIDEVLLYITSMNLTAALHRFENKLQELYTPESRLKVAYNCPPDVSSEVPTSVHALRPGDIRVIGAMGDSLTSGFGIGAKTVVGLKAVEERGLSFSIGGETNLSDSVTLPNILKLHQQALTGYSTGPGLVGSEQARFNVAHPGDTASNMPVQGEELVQRIKMDSTVNFMLDWKMVTLFIGQNDICDYCKHPEMYSVAHFREHIEDALDILQFQLPRTFVNLVPVMQVSLLDKLNLGPICSLLHRKYCACAGYPEDPEKQQEIKNMITAYRQALEDIVASDRYNMLDDFTVVLQPVLNFNGLPLTSEGDVDLSYFAPDCFHLSRRGHEVAAVGLWNTMLTPVGQKQPKEWNQPIDSLHCLSEDKPYLFTSKNSAPEAEDGDSNEETPEGSKLAHSVYALLIIILISVIVFAFAVTYSLKKKHQESLREVSIPLLTASEERNGRE